MWSKASLVLLVSSLLLTLATANILPKCVDSGLKISITKLEGSSFIDDGQIVYSSKDNQIVFARTSNGDVWRSKNEGETWTKITVPEKMPEIAETAKKVWQVVVGAQVKGIAAVYLLGYAGTYNEPSGIQRLWVSLDNGETWNLRAIPTNIRRIVPHPQRLTQALFLRQSSLQQIDVYMTKDAAESFPARLFERVLNLNVTWGPANQHPDRIYALFADQNALNAFWSYRLVYTDDFFKSATLVVDHVYWYTQRNDDDFIAVQFEDPTNPRKTRMILSRNGGTDWHVATFYDEGGLQIEEQGYIIYDAEPESVITGIMRETHGDITSRVRYADIFKSEGYDRNPILSRKFHYMMDFAKLESVDGVYLSNFFDVDENELAEPTRTTDIRTLVTFNKGAQWQPLIAPEKKWDGSLYNCDINKGCSLHLHGVSSGSAFSWIYSVPNAVGLVLGTGNVGEELHEGVDEVHTYISRDAGVIWHEVSQGARVPEYGDHGGVIVLIDPSKPTNNFMYTTDEGLTWQSCEFSQNDEKFRLRNIRISPSFNSRQFIAYGVSSSNVPVVVSIDFASSLRNCDAESDYEEWTPTDGHSHCVMGKMTHYRRRKPGAKCWNGEEFDRITRTEICACAETDYECSFCFRRDYRTGKCVFDCFHDPEAASELPRPSSEQCKEGETYYTVAAGVQKIMGDQCDEKMSGSVPVPKSLVPCDISDRITPSGLPASNSPMLLIAAIILLVVAAIAAVFMLAWSRSERFRQCFGKKPVPVGFTQVETLYEEESDDEENQNNDSSDDLFGGSSSSSHGSGSSTGGMANPSEVVTGASEDFFAQMPPPAGSPSTSNPGSTDEPQVGSLI